MSADRGRTDNDVSLCHHGRNPWQGPDGICAHRHRSCADAHSLDQHPGNQHICKSGTQHGPCAFRGWLGTCAALVVLGCAIDWGRLRGFDLPLASSRTRGRGDWVDTSNSTRVICLIGLDLDQADRPLATLSSVVAAQANVDMALMISAAFSAWMSGWFIKKLCPGRTESTQ